MSTTPPRRRWYQFDWNDVALGAALVAFGFGGIVLQMDGIVSLGVSMPKRVETGLTLAIALGLYAAVGAGFGSPFKRKLLGAAIALFVIGAAMLAASLP